MIAEATTRSARASIDKRQAARARIPTEGKSGSPAGFGGAEGKTRLVWTANNEGSASAAQMPTKERSGSPAGLGGGKSEDPTGADRER